MVNLLGWLALLIVVLACRNTPMVKADGKLSRLYIGLTWMMIVIPSAFAVGDLLGVVAAWNVR